MLTFMLGFQGPIVTVVAAIIVIVYSAFGGIRSVTITDVFQFITFSIFNSHAGTNHLESPMKDPSTSRYIHLLPILYLVFKPK